MKKLAKKASIEQRKLMDSEINFLSKAYQAERLNYSKIKSNNLPLGSGAIESLIRQAVNLRIKGNGKFWLEENAEIILHARCQWLAARWDEFSDSVLTRRIYPRSV